MTHKDHPLMSIALILASGLGFAANTEPKTDPQGPQSEISKTNKAKTDKPHKDKSARQQSTEKNGRSLRAYCREHSC